MGLVALGIVIHSPERLVALCSRPEPDQLMVTWLVPVIWILRTLQSTVTWKRHSYFPPVELVVVQFTRVAPTGNRLPDGGVHSTW